MEERDIGGIGNYYGGLWVRTDGVRFWWSIENYDGHEWEEIPEALFRALVEYEDARGMVPADAE